MDKFENKLSKLDQIDAAVASMNTKVVKLEKEAKLMDNRMDQVERSAQVIHYRYCIVRGHVRIA